MIFAFNGMNRFNKFIKKLYSRPSLLWKGGAGMLFLGLSLAMFFVPTFVYGLDKGTRLGFAFLLLIYGLFRFSTFYIEYNQNNDE